MSAKQRRRITSLGLLATLLLTQHRVHLVTSATKRHCWLIFSHWSPDIRCLTSAYITVRPTSRIQKVPVPRGTAVSLVMSSEDNPVMSSLTIPLKTRVKETLAIGNWPAFFTAALAVLIHGMRLWQKSCLWAHEELFSEFPPARMCFQLSRPNSRTPVEQKLQACYLSRLVFFLLPALLHDCSAIEQSPSKI